MHWIKKGEKFSWKKHGLHPSELSLNARIILWFLAQLTWRHVLLKDVFDFFHHVTEKSRRTLEKQLVNLKLLNLVVIHNKYPNQTDARERAVSLTQDGRDFVEHHGIALTNPESFGERKHHDHRVIKIINTLKNRESRKKDGKRFKKKGCRSRKEGNLKENYLWWAVFLLVITTVGRHEVKMTSKQSHRDELLMLKRNLLDISR